MIVHSKYSTSSVPPAEVEIARKFLSTNGPASITQAPAASGCPRVAVGVVRPSVVYLVADETQTLA